MQPPNRPVRFLTQNIQGLNNTAKQLQLLNELALSDIQFLGLAETKLLHKQSKYIYKNNPHYNAYFNNDSPTSNGSGVGLLVAKPYAKFIHKVTGYKGRVIYADLYLKGKTKLRIV